MYGRHAPRQSVDCNETNISLSQAKIKIENRINYQIRRRNHAIQQPKQFPETLNFQQAWRPQVHRFRAELQIQQIQWNQ